ncbi:MAG: hypothetical protein ABW277_20175 [Longimicrobiaceae bacterium]
MDPRLWQHQTPDPGFPVPPPVSPWQSWLSILLVALVLVAFALYAHRQFRAPSAGGRRPILTGGGDLLGLIGAVVRGVFYLAFSFLLLGRLLFWPRGRRW